MAMFMNQLKAKLRIIIVKAMKCTRVTLPTCAINILVHCKSNHDHLILLLYFFSKGWEGWLIIFTFTRSSQYPLCWKVGFDGIFKPQALYNWCQPISDRGKGLGNEMHSTPNHCCMKQDSDENTTQDQALSLG